MFLAEVCKWINVQQIDELQENWVHKVLRKSVGLKDGCLLYKNGSQTELGQNKRRGESTITGIWLADIPRSEEAGMRLLSWTLLRFRRLVEASVPAGDTKQKVSANRGRFFILILQIQSELLIPVLQAWLQISAKGLWEVKGFH